MFQEWYLLTYHALVPTRISVPALMFAWSPTPLSACLSKEVAQNESHSRDVNILWNFQMTGLSFSISAFTGCNIRAS